MTALALAAAAWILAAEPAAPSLAELRHQGYRLFDLGWSSRAAAVAAEGSARAAAAADTVSLRAFEVLEAEVLVQDRRLTEALKALEAPLDGADQETQARAAMARALARCIGGAVGEQARRVAADLALAERLARPLGSALRAQVQLRRGTCAYVAGDRKAAEQDFRRVLAQARRERLPVLEMMAEGSVGLVLVQRGHYDEASLSLGRALAASEALGAEPLSNKTRVNLGWCAFQLGDYPRTLALLEKVATGSAVLEGDRVVALAMMGNALYRQERLAEARGRYEQALRLARQLGYRNLETQQLENLAEVALEEGALDSAQRYAEEAAAARQQDPDLRARASTALALGQIAAARNEGAKAQQLLRQVIAWPGGDPALVWEARAVLARWHMGAGRRDDAQAEYQAAFELMERSIGQVQAAESRLSFLSSLRRFQDDYVDFLVASGQEEAALEASDRSRARVLRERLGASAGAVRAADLRALAGKLDAVLLAYWLGPKRSFLWVISGDAVRLAVLPGREAIKRKIQEHQQVVLRSRDPVSEGTPSSSWLYDVLIRPAALPPQARVVAALDGVLHELSLETLVVPGPSPHYWIEDATLTVVPALGLLRSEGPRAPSPRRALLLGDPLPSGGFPALPQAGRELRYIAALFGPGESTVLAGPAATPEAWWKAEAGGYGFIHLAAHAEANPLSPLDSAVVLSPREDAPYKLYARDVAATALEADLVTLSACRGAGARAYAGEGLVGLAWAFLQSGAANVVGGLWDVEDTSTAQVMEELYRNVVEGKPPAEALRAAKLSLLRSGSARRKPYYWGPLVMVTRRPPPGGGR